MEMVSCPIGLQSNKVNIKNHLNAIKEADLGPADPLKPNNEYWAMMGKKWGISEGDARGRLCNNCEHYYDNPEIRDCIDNGPAKDIKASALPLTPKWADIEDKPIGYCNKWDITCSPIRTCEDQEILQREYEPDTETESSTESETYTNPFQSTVKDSINE